MIELHPFWSGLFFELKKEGIAGEALQLMSDPVVAGSVAAGGAALGMGGVALARRLGVPGTHRPAPPAPPAGGGLKGKHLLLAGLGGAALGAYAMKKRQESK